MRTWINTLFQSVHFNAPSTFLFLGCGSTWGRRRSRGNCEVFLCLETMFLRSAKILRIDSHWPETGTTGCSTKFYIAPTWIKFCQKRTEGLLDFTIEWIETKTKKAVEMDIWHNSLRHSRLMVTVNLYSEGLMYLRSVPSFSQQKT